MKDMMLQHNFFAHRSLVCPKYRVRHGDHYCYMYYPFFWIRKTNKNTKRSPRSCGTLRRAVW